MYLIFSLISSEENTVPASWLTSRSVGLESPCLSVLPRHVREVSFLFHTGVPTGFVHRQLLLEQEAGPGSQAAADPQRPCCEPAGLGDRGVAGPARQSGCPGQLGPLLFASASSGNTLPAVWSVIPPQCWLHFGNYIKMHRDVCVW